MDDLDNELLMVETLINRAKTAQISYENLGSQRIFDLASQAVAWAVMQPTNNILLSKLAVSETGLGNINDKIKKNHNKTLGLMRDLQDKKTFGHVSDDQAKGLSTYLRPKGVIAAIVPSTNPIATPTNNIINALKTGNAIILAPSPKGAKPLSLLLEKIYIELEKNNEAERAIKNNLTYICNETLTEGVEFNSKKLENYDELNLINNIICKVLIYKK